MTTAKTQAEKMALRALPGDEVRQIVWRFADRYDLQMAVQAVRALARGPVARMVADGARNSHEWTDEKAELLNAFDASGLTALGMDPEFGGYIEGPKNLALALAAFELSWVDGGSATSAMATNLALGPIHERGTPEQQKTYMSRCIPPQPGEKRTIWRGAFALTEPLPYVGVNTRVLSGGVRVAKWKEGEEPLLQVEKRGRFITNMAFANFVTAAVDSNDERIKGSCMIILHEDDPGVFDRGAPTRKLVHQLSSTNDPIFSLKVPASRIVGGYTVRDGVLVPNYDHAEIIAAVFRRTRVTVGLMTAAKLLSAVEPIIRYQRGRFRGGKTIEPGSAFHELGLQQKEDVLHRLVDIWASGEASAALGFAAARLFDDFDPIERHKDKVFEERGLKGRAQLKELKKLEKPALEYIELAATPAAKRDTKRFEELEADRLVPFMVQDAVANVLCPAVKLWNTGQGTNMMREAVSLMGGYGITEDCPGFIGQKWMDAQLEATYEGPEAVQRRQLAITMTQPVFLAHFRQWIAEMRHVAGRRPGTGACTIASAMELWLWTLRHLSEAEDADGTPLYRDKRQGVTFPMADALCWLLASRQQILDLLELESRGPQNEALAEGLPGYVRFFTDLCHVQAARAAGEVGRLCSELVFGYNRHPSWETEGAACYQADELEPLDGFIPGIAACARSFTDVVEADGSHPQKAGPCVCFTGMEAFTSMRRKLDGCLTGARMAKDRAARDLTQVMIPEVPDYPT
jgi:alkylation response protein AidB-like acyl-CoA dehydrogenase